MRWRVSQTSADSTNIRPKLYTTSQFNNNTPADYTNKHIHNVAKNSSVMTANHDPSPIQIHGLLEQITKQAVKIETHPGLTYIIEQNELIGNIEKVAVCVQTKTCKIIASGIINGCFMTQ